MDVEDGKLSVFPRPMLAPTCMMNNMYYSDTHESPTNPGLGGHFGHWDKYQALSRYFILLFLLFGFFEEKNPGKGHFVFFS